jgi:ATP-dependent Clp protease adapter protein ClpS
MLTYEDQKRLYAIWIDFIRKHGSTKEAKAALRQWACGNCGCTPEQIDKVAKAVKGSLKEQQIKDTMVELGDPNQISVEDPKTIKVRIRSNKDTDKNNSNQRSRQMSRKTKVLTERLTIRVRPEERELMEEIATLEDDRTLTEFVRRVLIDYLRRYRANRDFE